MPMKRGRAGTMSHDYRWHGTVDAFTASDVATGKIIRWAFRDGVATAPLYDEPVTAPTIHGILSVGSIEQND
ncbi:MAG TPA: hypothetical protein VFN61_08805 [Acidimicrobiales bacterium]|nr:hypothetical protein [Acidimicrobiales bacterium]